MVAIATLIAVAGTPVVAHGAQSVDGLTVESDITYTISAEQQRVDVRAEVTLTNTKPDRRVGNYIEYYYFEGFSLPIPDGAASIEVVSDGSSLTPELDDAESPFIDLAAIRFPTNLRYRQTRNVTLTYTLPGGEPRSGADYRINGAYALFPVWGIGDPDDTTVRVVAPLDFEVETFGSELTETEAFGQRVFYAEDIGDPLDFWATVSARNDDALVETPIELDEVDASAKLLSWPGDAKWRNFMTTQISDGIPAMVEIIGLDWPHSESIEFQEAFTPYLHGYSGYYITDEDNEDGAVIEVGEDLDQATALHELAHSWFNPDVWAERWIYEGFAEEVASRTAEALGEPLSEPGAPGPVPQGGPETLNGWSKSVFRFDLEAEDDVHYYDRAWKVMRELFDEVGPETMSEVFQLVDSEVSAYDSGDQSVTIPRLATWKNLIDYVEVFGGSEGAEELFRSEVATDDDAGRLDERAATRATYEKLGERGGDWDIPVVVRQRMSDWRFERAGQLIEAADEVLDRRDEVAEAADVLGVELPPSAQVAYEDATTNLDQATELLTESAKGLEDLSAARATLDADRSLFQRIGLWGEAPEDKYAAAVAFAEGDEMESTSEAAERAAEIVDGAESTGKSRALSAAGAVVGVGFVLAVLLWMVSRRRKPEQAQPRPDGT